MSTGAVRDSSPELKQKLIQASGAGNLAVVKYLIEGMKVQHNTCRDGDGCTPLNYASYYGQLHIVKYLIEEVRVNMLECKSSDGYTALHSATYTGQLDIVRYLIEDQDLEIDTRDYDGHTPLYWANTMGHTHVSTYLSSFKKSSALVQAPSLQQLLNFKSKTTHINVVEQIGTHYSSLGPFLLNDDTGAITKAIESQYKLDAFSINHEILSRWLQGKGKTPVSWRTLIDTLKTIKLSTLAENIESCF